MVFVKRVLPKERHIEVLNLQHFLVWRYIKVVTGHVISADIMNTTWVSTVLVLVVLFQTIDQSNARFVKKSASKAVEKYAVICDAGSSGTRIKVYKLVTGVHDPIEVSDVKELDVPDPDKVEPGISSFAGSVGDIGSNLDDLIDSARQVVPADQQASTPIYVYATAGMRLLDDDERNAVINEIIRLLSDKRFSPFYFENNFIKVISGQEEAFYGWITVNFLKGVFSQKSGRTYGALDLGGASTQNTFRTKNDSALVTFEPTLAGKTYPVYAHSYLSYGVDEARQSYFEYLVSKRPNKKKIKSFCHNKGYKDVITINDKKYRVVGKYKGKFCKKAIANKIFCQNSDVEKCPFIAQPQLKGNFYGFGAIYFALRDVGLLTEDDQVVTLPQIKNSADTFCAKPAKDLDTSMYDIYNLCFQLNYIYELLKDGYNAHEDLFTLRVAKELHGFDLNWVLGAMLKATKAL